MVDALGISSQICQAYNKTMSRSVKIKTRIPSAEEIAERLGMGTERQKMLRGIVRHHNSISVHRNTRLGLFVSEKTSSRSKSEKSAKAKS